MNIQEYLSQYRRLREMIKYDTGTLKVLRLSTANTPAPKIESDPVQTSPSGQAPYVRIMERIEWLEEKVSLEEQLLNRLRDEIMQMTDILDSREAYLISLRYILCNKWNTAISNLHTSRATAFRWHDEILAKLQLPEHPINIDEELAKLEMADNASAAV